MATILQLEGWNVSVQRTTFEEPGGNGLPEKKQGFVFLFTEVRPPTGNKIAFRMTKEIAELVAKEIRGVQIFGPGDIEGL